MQITRDFFENVHTDSWDSNFTLVTLNIMEMIWKRQVLKSDSPKQGALV